MIAGTVLTILVLSARRGSTRSSSSAAHPTTTRTGTSYLASGLQHPNAINSISFGLALLLGTAGLPHLLMRFFTVPDAKAARGSIAWGVLLIGLFFTMTMLVGVGARAILGRHVGRRDGRRQPRDAAARGVARRRRGLGRRRPVPRDHQRRRVRDDPRGRGGPRDRRLGRRGPRRVERRDPPRQRRRAGRGARRAHRVGLARRPGDRGVDPRGRDVQRLDPRGARVRGGREREPAGAAHGAVLAAVQHDRRHRRRGRRPAVGADRHRAQPAGVAGRGQRRLADPAREPGDHLDPRRLHLLLARDDAEHGERRGAQLPRAEGAVGDRDRRGRRGPASGTPRRRVPPAHRGGGGRRRAASRSRA